MSGLPLLRNVRYTDEQWPPRHCGGARAGAGVPIIFGGIRERGTGNPHVAALGSLLEVTSKDPWSVVPPSETTQHVLRRVGARLCGGLDQ